MRNEISRALVPALLLFATPAAAQQRDLWKEYDGPRRIEISASGSLFLSTDWSDNIIFESFTGFGVTQRQVLLRGFSMAPKVGGTGAFTYWKGRYGFRVYAGFVDSCITTRNRCEGFELPSQIGLPVVEVDMNQWMYGVQGIVGLQEWTPTQWFRPYFIVGGGGVTYDVDSPLSTILPGPITTTGPITIGDDNETVAVVGNPGTFIFAIDDVGIENKFALNLGIGMDLRIPFETGGIGLRFEMSDHITQSPLSVRVASLDGDGFGCNGFCNGFNRIDEIEFDRRTVHNWRLSAGIFLEFGVRGYNPPPVEF